MKQELPWQFQQAKARLDDLVENAKYSPQFIRVRDQCEVVILSAERYVQLVQREFSFVDFIRQSPLLGVEMDIERNQSVTRDVVDFACPIHIVNSFIDQ